MTLNSTSPYSKRSRTLARGSLSGCGCRENRSAAGSNPASRTISPFGQVGTSRDKSASNPLFIRVSATFSDSSTWTGRDTKRPSATNFRESICESDCSLNGSLGVLCCVTLHPWIRTVLTRLLELSNSFIQSRLCNMDCAFVFV